MKRNNFAILFFCIGALVYAQPIPGRYIVEFQDAPAAAVSAAARTRFSTADPAIAARRAQIRAEHDLAEQAIRPLGGAVRARYDTVFNGLAVDIDAAGASRLRQMPNVRAVYPDMRHELYLDHAVNVHKIRDVWQSVAGGQAGAGAGIKIGIIDSGIDTKHLAFQGFSTGIPAGFPITSSDREKDNTNNKVIVMRDYTGLGGLDTFGHGTGVAMAAAGLMTDARVQGFSAFSGVAPGAWLGSYRTIDDNGGTTSSLFLRALQDAVADGMNVINYSAGGALTDSGREQGPEARAIDAATAAGVLVVVAAGNNGPEPGTLGFPGIVTNAITAGANFNERILDDAVILADLAPYEALAPASPQFSTEVRGPMTDVSSLDNTGFACSAFPAGSLTGKIALISRSIIGSADACSFDLKINNAQAAGAIGAVIYNSDPQGGLVGMKLDTATLPAIFVLNSSGMEMKRYLAGTPDANAVIDFTGSTPIAFSSDSIAIFSSGGPTPGAALKPDIMATGAWLLTATTTQGNTGLPYTLEFGTSFSAPIVSGAAAVLMAARPGLTAAQYRSLLIDSAPPLNWPTGGLVPPQIAGAGKLDLSRSMQNTLAAAPASLNFRSASGTVDLTKSFVVSNVGTDSDAFTVTAKPLNTDGLMPQIDVTSFSLDKGASQTINVRMAGGDPAPGEYQGFLEITGTKTGVATRVPYWLGVPGTSAKFIALQQQVDQTTRSFGETVSFIFRTLDIAGLPIAAGDPQITFTGARAAVESISPIGDIPGTYQAAVRVGRAGTDGTNVFTITVGGTSRDVTFFVR
jgi:minor extracellular serine protease Vpr